MRLRSAFFAVLSIAAVLHVVACDLSEDDECDPAEPATCVGDVRHACQSVTSCAFPPCNGSQTRYVRTEQRCAREMCRSTGCVWPADASDASDEREDAATDG